MALLFSLIVTIACFGAESGREPAWKRPWKGLPELLAVLGSVPEGESILARAKEKDPNFLDRIQLGSASFTESTFARSYSLLDGKEKIELRHEVTLNRRLPLGEAVVDLAHELVHFTEKAMLDPYKPGFELKEFIRRGIEGPGGELTALRSECLVAWALEKRYRNYPRHQLCAPYRAADGSFRRDQALADYYALGRWMSRAPASLIDAIPNLSSDPVVFTSSYARKPYPIALTEEFEATREAACANNRKKYRLIAAQAEGGRAPAGDLLARERRRLKTYDRLYCRPGNEAREEQ